jgi:hypothetical protein
MKFNPFNLTLNSLFLVIYFLPINSTALGYDTVINNNCNFINRINKGTFPYPRQMNSTIEGTVWTDKNGDGIRNVGESRIPGAEIELLDEFGLLINSTVSDNNGQFSFEGLFSGEYTVHFVSISSHFITAPNVNGGTGQDNDATNDSDADPATGYSFLIAVGENQIVSHIDAGFYQAGNISGVVWSDSNGDGKRQATEKKLSGWIVTILHENDSLVYDVYGNLVRSTTTNSLGSYKFQGLVPGVYKIKWILQYYCPITKSNYSGKINDNDDIGDDSDILSGGSSHKIYITSGRSVQGVDAGTTERLEIQGRVFYDLLKTGIFNSPSNGIQFCVIELRKTDNDSPCPGQSSTLVNTMVTDDSGFYRFSNLSSGNYILRIATSNFEPGGPLHNMTGSTPLEYCINVNCLSVVSEYHFGVFKNWNGGESWPQWPNCEIASQHPVICDLMELDGFSGVMLQETSPDPVPKPLCSDGGTSHNMSWFSFVAGHGQYEISLSPKFCNPGGGGLLGIQAGIFKDCTFSDYIYCQSECTADNITMPTTSLIPGEIYYFFLDGCAGSVCQYEIDIKGNYTPYSFPDSSELKLILNNKDTFCTKEEVTFSVDGLNQRLDYSWKITDINNLPVEIDYPQGWPNTSTNQITLRFPRKGVFKVCMEMANNKCEFRGPYCKTITVQEPAGFNIIKRDTIVESGHKFKSQIYLPGDSLSTLFILPIQNNNIAGLKNDTLLLGAGDIDYELHNLTSQSQVAKFVLFKDSTNLPICKKADTLSITVLPSLLIHNENISICKDTCLTLSAIIPDSLTFWTKFLWSTNDTTQVISLCPTNDSIITLFVKDTLGLYYKLQFNIIIKDGPVVFAGDEDIKCTDSTLTLTYQGYFNPTVTNNTFYRIFDCRIQDTPIYESFDSTGTIDVSLDNQPEFMCFNLVVNINGCLKDTSITIYNPRSLIGQPCDDNDPITINDIYDVNCECNGEIIISTTSNSLNDVKIFPNPTQSSVFVVQTGIKQNFEVSIYNAMGEFILINKIESENGYEIATSELLPGVYIIKIQRDKIIGSSKLVKY